MEDKTNSETKTPKSYPEPVVGVIIFNPEGKIFLMKTHKWNGKYCIPGGHVELGEKMEDTVKREVKEETDLDVYDIKFANFGEAIYSPDFWKKKHFVFANFTARTKTNGSGAKSSSNVVLNHEAEEYVWVTPEEALKLPLNIYTEDTIRKISRK